MSEGGGISFARRDDQNYSSIFSSKNASLLNHSRHRDLTPNPSSGAGRTIVAAGEHHTAGGLKLRSTSPQKLSTSRGIPGDRHSPSAILRAEARGSSRNTI